MNMDIKEDELMTLSPLSVKLRKIGVIDMHRETLRRWSKRGVKRYDGETVKLKVIRMGVRGSRYSTVRWVNEFLEKLVGAETN